jgi:curved DNA-binding protein CbpA
VTPPLSLYDVLDVPTDADAEAVKRAHRRAARRHHPDKGGDRDDFERIQHAYLVLADPERRRKYDATGVPRRLRVRLRPAAPAGHRRVHDKVRLRRRM